MSNLTTLAELLGIAPHDITATIRSKRVRSLSSDQRAKNRQKLHEAQATKAQRQRSR